MEETQKSKRTTSHCFLKADISILVRVGHFYFGLTYSFTIIDIVSNRAYIPGVRHEKEFQVKAKTNKSTAIDQYIEGFPDNIKRILSDVRSTIKKAAPDATEKISYQMPSFYYNGNLVWFAAFKNHIGFYPTASGIAEFQDDLKNYKHAKGSVQFPIDQPIPLKLITKIVKFRVTENAAKKPKGKKKKVK